MTTRDAIQKYLEGHPFSCAEELSEALAKTRANIQYHLKRLEADGVIVQVTKSGAALDRGRPRTYYSLSTHAKPDNLLPLASALLQLYLRDKPDGAIDAERLAALAQAILTPKSPASSSTARLNHLVKELSARNYQARWEAHASGPEIIFRCCPYAALIAQHPELCQMDAQLLKANLGSPYRQISKIHLPITPACRFIIDTANASKQSHR